ncbi:MAG: hypothetical protein IIV19_05170 [Bacteroidaceae bacterium]|nr:hypothetical protein [Bacteroidaceae bacterium]
MTVKKLCCKIYSAAQFHPFTFPGFFAIKSFQLEYPAFTTGRTKRITKTN